MKEFRWFRWSYIFFYLKTEFKEEWEILVHWRLGFQWIVIASIRFPRQVVTIKKLCVINWGRSTQHRSINVRYLMLQSWASYIPGSWINFLVRVECRKSRIPALKCCPSATSSVHGSCAALQHNLTTDMSIHNLYAAEQNTLPRVDWWNSKF